MKKALALVLAALMLVPGQLTAFAAPSKTPPPSAASAYPEQMQDAGLKPFKSSDAYSETDEVTAIIELRTKPDLQNSEEGLTVRNEKQLIRQQNAVLKTISKKVLDGQKLTILHSYTSVTNGFSVVVPYGKLDEIREIPEVSAAYVAPSFKVAPNMPTKTTVMGGLENATGYHGEGTVIAIVDSGLALDHPAFAAAPNAPALDEQGVADALAKNDLNAETSRPEGAFTADQVYHGNKVPFAFDYADRDLDVTPGQAGDHGTHVAGIAAANAGVTADVVGVASEAQLLALKVFSSHGSGLATWDSILAAMDDAVYLGADVINLSLGSTCGFTSYDWEEGVADTINRVTSAGVSLSVACGNEYSAAFFNRIGKSHALNQNPDYGTVASPASYNASLAVASVEKKATMESSYFTVGQRKIAFNDISEADNVNVPSNVPSFKSLGTDKALSYVVVPGVGDPADYEGLDVTGKIALVSRGTNSYEVKKNAAKAAGAAALLVCNNEPGMSYMEMDTYDLPAAFISQTDGKAMRAVAEDQRTLTISAAKGDLDSPTSGQMSDFSSWGVTPELTLKPDITAPGGNIKSTSVNGSYTTKSGTSMAAPFISGAIAVAKQYVEAEHADLAADPVQMGHVVDALLMSTADPVEINGLPYSPRKQGAGLVNVDKAISSPAYLTAGSQLGRPKLELGADPQKSGVYKLSFQVHNWSDQMAAYTLGGTVQTDGTQVTKQYKGKDVHQITELPYQLEAKVPSQDVIVPAGETKTISTTVTLTQKDKAYLDQNFANGIYVEGFLTLTPADETSVSLSLPYMGFYGDWTKASVIDRGFYWNDLNDEENWASQYTNTAATTSLERTIDTYLGDNPYHKGVPYLQDRNAISPNGDDYMDKLDVLYTGLLRNVETLTYTITDPENPDKVYYEQKMDHVPKSVYSGGYYRIVPAGVDEYTKITPWDGKDHGISLKNNAKALVTVSATLPDTKAPVHNEKLSWSFPLTIDTEEPTIESVKVREENNKFFVDLVVKDNQYVSNICFADASVQKALASYPVSEKTAGATSELSYDVTGLGQKLTLVVNDYACNRREESIKVEGNVDESQIIVPTKTVFMEDFETSTFPANDWTLKSKSDKTWYHGSQYGSKMACCAVSPSEQQEEWLISPAIDLSKQETKAGIVFDYYASYYWAVEQHEHNLKVKASTDGQNWEDIWQLWDVKNEFGAWEKTQAKVIIPDKFQKAPNVQFAFVYEGTNSTELWMDNVQVYVDDPAMTHTITATAGEGGTISPEGTVKISHNMDRTFTIQPNEGYILADVTVDGKSVGPKNSYTFEKVTADHTISAVFSAIEGGNTSLLIDEDFEEQAIPKDWTVTGINNTYSWKAYQYFKHWGAYCSVDTYDPDPSYDQPGDPQDERLTLPALDLNGKTASMSFQFTGSKRELSRGNMTATVEASSDNGQTWTEIWNAQSAVDSLKEGVFSSYVGTGDITLTIPDAFLKDGVQLSFRYQHPQRSSDGGPVFVDNVKVLASGSSVTPDPDPQPPVSSDLLNEDFESLTAGNTLPAGWDLERLNATSTWKISKYAGSMTAYVSDDYTDYAKQDERLLTPVLDLSGGDAKISFRFVGGKYPINNKDFTLKLEARTEAGTWQPLWSSADETNYTPDGDYRLAAEVSVSVPADLQTAGTQFAFRYERPAGESTAPCSVDNVKVTAASGSVTPDPDPDPQPPVSDALLHEDFEGQTMPEGWTTNSTNSTYTWKIHKYIKDHWGAYCDADLYEEDPWGGGWSMEHDLFSGLLKPLSGAKQDERLVTPALALNGKTGKLAFQFTASKTCLKRDEMTVTVEATSDNGQTWTEIWNAKSAVDSLKEGYFNDYVATGDIVLDIPAEFQKDNVQFAFRYQRPAASMDGGIAFVDNVDVTAEGGTAPEPPASEFTITASAGQGGSIAPRGQVTVKRDADQTFTVTPSQGYEIADVLVDGTSIGAKDTYTFQKVDKDHTIAASFSKLPEVLPTSIHEDFNTSDGLPEKWHIEGISTQYETWKVGRFDALGRSNAMVCTQNFMGSQKQDEKLCLPEIQMPNPASLSFDWGATFEQVNSGSIQFTVQATLDKGQSWTTIWDAKEHLPAADSLTSEDMTAKADIAIPAKFCVPGARFAFVFTSEVRQGGSVAVDNVVLSDKEAPTPNLYAITVAAMENGSVVPSQTTAREGDTITITVTPDPGYQLKAGSLMAGDIVVKDNTFKMPGKAVEISALFEKIVTPPSEVRYKDGTYQGEAQGRNGVVKVEVTVTDGAISNIKVLEQKETPDFWTKAEAMLDRLTGKADDESIRNTDTVTGATISSTAIKNAVLDALQNAVDMDSGIFDSGDGSVKFPYIIKTVKQLQDFAAAVNAGETYAGKIIALNNDLSLKDIVWTPIGTSNHEKYTGFAGTFDGRGHTVRDVTCGTGSEPVSYEAMGFFGVVDKGGMIKNLNLTIAKYYNSCDTDASVFTGGLVGILGRNATVDHCTVTTPTTKNGKDMTISENSGRNGAVGAIVGKMLNGSLIANSWADAGLSYGTINFEKLDVAMGGICGIQSRDSLIANCASFGSVPGMIIDGVLRVGGLVGHTDGAIYNCYTNCLTKANVMGMDVDQPAPASTAVGHLIGSSKTNAALYNCYYDKNAPQFSNTDLAAEPDEGKPERRQAAGWDPVTQVKSDLTHVTACETAELTKSAFANTMNKGLRTQAVNDADLYFQAKNLLNSSSISSAENLLSDGFYRWDLIEGLVLLDGTKPQPTPKPQPSVLTIQSVTKLDAQSVPFGTAQDQLSLPKTVEVTLSNGKTQALPVTWSCETYNAQKAGTYTFTGALVLPDGITNPNGLKAQLDVVVAPAAKVTLTFNTNGGTQITNLTLEPGTVIDLTPYRPIKSGHTFEGWYSDEALTQPVTSVMVDQDTTVFAKWAKEARPNPFLDVPEGTFFYDAVLWAVDNGITTGITPTKFGPEVTCTRAQAMAFLWRANGCPEPETTSMQFVDVPENVFYVKAVQWAVEKGITKGITETKFGPESDCTRAQIVTFLYRSMTE